MAKLILFGSFSSLRQQTNKTFRMTFLKLFNFSEYISSPSNTGDGPNHQRFIPNPLRKSKQHFRAHHFFNGSAASASM
jgi:hypothetical protein